MIFSLANLWKVAIKTSLDRAGFSVDPAVLLRGLLAEGIVKLPLRLQHFFIVASLPWVPKGPFDGLLLAQAAEEGVTLLTADATLRRFGKFVKVV